MHELHNYQKYKVVRKILRNLPTHTEKLLWLGLKDSKTGFKWRRQQSIGNFVVDFYCAKLKLVIEVDGITHDEKAVQEKDKLKEQFLKDNHFTVIRFTDDQVVGNINKVLKKITQVCQQMTTP
ncbi:MAG: endonuclease domain-containing protein [Patescibacteria group bacterium]